MVFSALPVFAKGYMMQVLKTVHLSLLLALWRLMYRTGLDLLTNLLFRVKLESQFISLVYSGNSISKRGYLIPAVELPLKANDMDCQDLGSPTFMAIKKESLVYNILIAICVIAGLFALMMIVIHFMDMINWILGIVVFAWDGVWSNKRLSAAVVGVLAYLWIKAAIKSTVREALEEDREEREGIDYDE